MEAGADAQKSATIVRGGIGAISSEWGSPVKWEDATVRIADSFSLDSGFVPTNAERSERRLRQFDIPDHFRREGVPRKWVAGGRQDGQPVILRAERGQSPPIFQGEP